VARGLAAVLAVTVMTCALPACGEDGAATKPPSVVVITTTDPSASKVVLSAPSSVDAGPVRIVLRNRGDTLHDAQMLRVDGKHSAAEVADVLELTDSFPKPRWLHPAGGVAAVAPGDSAAVRQVLKPGTYVIADTQERSGPRARITNAIKGGIVELEVAPPDDAQELPPTRARIVAGARGFDATGLRAGRQRVTFANRGDEPHQVAIVPLPDKGAFASVLPPVLDREGDTRWVPVDLPAERATTLVEPGDAQITEMRLNPGRYVMLCFVSDWVEGGQPQWSDGMASELHIRGPKSTGAARDAAQVD
jgi:hypothetical protein